MKPSNGSRMASPLNLTPGGSVSTPRNSFDMGFHSMFTSPAGMLLPNYVQDVQPGDYLKLDVSSFSRTMPVNTAAFSRFKEKTDFYFVPYRLLWRWWDQFFTGITDWRSMAAPNSVAHNEGGGTLPSVTGAVISNAFTTARTTNLKDVHGYPIQNSFERLLDLLGYPVVNSTDSGDNQPEHYFSTEFMYDTTYFATKRFNMFRAMAYQYIYNQFYRQNDYVASEAPSFNIDDLDYAADITEDRIIKMLTPRYVKWRLDRFTSVKPAPVTQFTNTGFLPQYLDGFKMWGDAPYVARITSQPQGTTVQTTINTTPTNSNTSIQAIRAGFALDRVARRVMLTPKTIEAQMKSSFGVGTSDHCQARYLGSYDSDLTIGEVTATSSGTAGQTATTLGELAGKGISSGRSNRPVSQKFDEAGIVMGIHYFIPDAEYDSSRIDDFVVKTGRTDYFLPEYDNLGMVPLLRGTLPWNCYGYTNIPDPNQVVGYQARYPEYKSRVNQVHGLFQSQSFLRSWVTPRNSSTSANWAIADLLVNPKITDNIFAMSYNGEQVTDPFLCHYRFDATLVRNMSVIGIPANNQTI